MRMLTIGYSLPNKDIDNYNVLTAPSYSDYEALIVDPQSITDVVRKVLTEEETFTAHDGRPVVNGSTSAGGVSIADQVRRRGDETRRLLESGGTVLVFGRPNATLAGVIGYEGVDRYGWLPAPAGVSWDRPLILAAEGKRIDVTADTHPLADVIRDFRKDVVYRAVFEMEAEPVRGARVVARGGSNAPVAVEFPVLAGKVVFVPVLGNIQGSRRMAMAQRVLDAVRLLLGTSSAESAPFWARTIAVPGLEQVEAELEAAEREADEKRAAADGVAERASELAGHRELYWADGHAYTDAVARALRTIGFTVTSEPDEALTVTADGETAFVEAVSAPAEVVEWPYVHLQRRLESHLLEHGEALKGIVVANAHRTKKLDDRGDWYSEPLRLACENYRYALVGSDTLFGLVQRALAGTTVDELAPARRRIMRAAGVLDLETAVGDAGESVERGPIF